MHFVAAQLRKNVKLDDFHARGDGPADFAHAANNGAPLGAAPPSVTQAGGGFDAWVVDARDNHECYGPTRPKVQHSQATGPAIKGASMMSSTPPRPRSQVLLS